jgi:ubiquinone/menaquinone biosynthesis C-methylase UbiE
MWTLDATDVKVIEKEERNLNKLSGPKEQLEYLKRNLPSAFEGRSIEFIVKDMSEGVDELPSNHFDLAYCERVLYLSVPDLQKVQSAINEMARVVKPGARVIAVEAAALDDFGNPIDFHSLFIKAGLIEEYLKDAPENAYCYKKPL